MAGDKKLQPGTHTQGALKRKALAKLAHQEQLDKAVALVLSGAGGPWTVSGMVEDCSVSQIKTAVAKAMMKKTFRASWAIMTDIENKRLVEWLMACADNDNPATESEVSEQVTKMLQ